MAKIVAISEAKQLTRADVSKWLTNARNFLAPVAIIYLADLAPKMNDGFSWGDFRPDAMVQGAMVLYLINVLLDLSRKWAGETKYYQ